jgi:hypothetical protein
VGLSEKIAHERPLYSVSSESFDNNAESLYGLWRANRVAQMESRHLGQSHLLQRFLSADLGSQGESGIQRRIRSPRSVRRRVVGQGRMRAVLMRLPDLIPALQEL